MRIVVLMSSKVLPGIRTTGILVSATLSNQVGIPPAKLVMMTSGCVLTSVSMLMSASDWPLEMIGMSITLGYSLRSHGWFWACFVIPTSLSAPPSISTMPTLAGHASPTLFTTAGISTVRPAPSVIVLVFAGAVAGVGASLLGAAAGAVAVLFGAAADEEAPLG